MHESTLDNGVAGAHAAVETEAKPARNGTQPNRPVKRPSAPARDAFTPSQRDRFTVALRPVMAGGADALGDPSRAPLTPAEAVELLGATGGVHGITLTDDDLAPVSGSDLELAKLRSDFKRALTKHKLKVAAIACDLAREGVFRDGAFTSGDAEVRAYTVQKTMRAMDLGAELGAKLMTFDLAREGSDVLGALDPLEARKQLHQALNFLCVYSKQKKYGYRFALAPQRAGLRRDRLWPTSAHHLVHIPALEHEDMVGVSFAVDAERAAGFAPGIALAQVIAEQRFYHIDLGRLDDAPSRDHFDVLRVIEESTYEGFFHIDSGVMRAADAEGVAAALTNAMRRVLMLRARARQWKGDARIRAAKRALSRPSKAIEPIERGFTVAGADSLLMRSFDKTKMREQKLPYEQLDARGSDILLS